METTLIQARVDTNLKNNAAKLFDNLGLDMTTAIKIFLKKCLQEGGIPFDVRQSKNEAVTADGMQAFLALRRQAEENGIADMSLDEINEEIRAARKERKARRKA